MSSSNQSSSSSSDSSAPSGRVQSGGAFPVSQPRGPRAHSTRPPPVGVAAAGISQQAAPTGRSAQFQAPTQSQQSGASDIHLRAQEIRTPKRAAAAQSGSNKRGKKSNTTSTQVPPPANLAEQLANAALPPDTSVANDTSASNVTQDSQVAGTNNTDDGGNLRRSRRFRSQGHPPTDTLGELMAQGITSSSQIPGASRRANVADNANNANPVLSGSGQTDDNPLLSVAIQERDALRAERDSLLAMRQSQERQAADLLARLEQAQNAEVVARQHAQRLEAAASNQSAANFEPEEVQGHEDGEVDDDDDKPMVRAGNGKRGNRPNSEIGCIRNFRRTPPHLNSRCSNVWNGFNLSWIPPARQP